MTVKLRPNLPYAVLILIKLALVGSLPMTALPTYTYDEALFVRLAAQIARGHWLGPYGPFTLAKGPGYPMFIAAAYQLGIPLSLAHQLLYVLFCVVFVIALAPVIKSYWARLFLFVVILFNPVSCQIAAFANANQEGIYPALTGLVLAAAIAMAIRHNAPLAKLFSWAVGLGVALGYFWIIREEGIWIVPSLVLLLGFGVIAVLRRPKRDLIGRFLIFLAVPAGLCMAIVCTVCEINKINYGQFLVTETKDPAFVAAYGALARVEPAKFQRYLPVARETRLRIYAISPTFAKLQPYLDGDFCAHWVGSTAATYPQYRGEIGAGWFFWAMRESITPAGYGANSRIGHDFFKQVAREVNAACDDGRLKAGPRRDTMIPPWRWDDLPLVTDAFKRGALLLSNFTTVRSILRPAEGTAQDRKEFARMVGGTITEAATDGSSTSLDGVVAVKLDTIRWIMRRYRFVGPAWSALSLVIFIVLSAFVIRGYRTWLWPAAAALLGAVFVRLAMLSYIDATSFSAINTLYLSCCYPLLLAFNVFMTVEAAGALRRKWAATRYPKSTASTPA